MQGQVDVFNALNANTDLSYLTINFGLATYLRPATNLQGRMIRMGVQLRW